LGKTWGEVVTTRPAHEYAARASFAMNRPGPIRTNERVSVPQLSLRRYHNPTVAAYQVVMTDGFYLPDTFRHPLQPRLNHHLLHDVSRHLATYGEGVPPAPQTRLKGDYFYFDTEYPGHFGHVMSEVISRYWGWQAAVERCPNLRPLVSLREDGRGWPGFQQEVFAALDIPVDRVEFVREGTPVTVESLFAATPAFALPNYSDDALAEVWCRVASRLGVAGRSTPERFFVTRGDDQVRPCHNREEVEQFFANRGFEIVDPATMPLSEQIAMFSQADIIAGFGGSGMFNAMFSPNSRKIIVSGDSYTANNEYLIGAASGGSYCYAWGTSDVPHPPGGWSWDAFVSGFRVDLESVGPFVDRWIDQPEKGGDARSAEVAGAVPRTDPQP
jgi:capsular polysaccharide biosynthesis protein